MLRPTTSGLVLGTTTLGIFVLFTAGTGLAQEPVAGPPDDAPREAFASPAPRPQKANDAAIFRSQAAPPLPQLAPPMIGGGTWLAEGPGPAIDGQVEGIFPGPDEVVGAVHTVAAHPTDADILYAGGTNGGVWKTTNALSSSPFWTPLIDDKPSLSIGALEFDPIDGTHMTVVAGIGRYSSFGQVGGAHTGKLLKTTDGGSTWSELAGFLGSASAAGISGVAPRGTVIVASANTSDMFFCSDIGLWRSVDGGTTFGKLLTGAGIPEGVAFDLASDPASPSTLYTGITFATVCSGAGAVNGIFKSTDTGASWSKVSDAAMEALILDSTTNNIEIAAHGPDVYVNIVQDGQTAGIFHSADAGGTWTAMDLPLTPEGPAIGITGASFTTPIVITSASPLASMATGDYVTVSGVTGNTAANGVFQITVTGASTFELRGSVGSAAYTGGGTYAEVAGLNPRNKPGGQGGIHASIRVDPATPSTVYIGGDRQNFPNFIGASDFSGRLFRGDATIPASGPPQSIPSPQWEHLTHSDSIAAIPGGGTANDTAPHADSREMVFDAGGDLVEGDDGGIYVRTTPTSNSGDWLSLNGNLQVTEQHDVAYDAISNVIISGNQDTGTTQQQLAGGNLTWDSISTADGGDVAVDDVSVPTVSTRYSSFQYLGAFRRREYDTSNGLISETFPTQTLIGASSVPVFNFVTPVELNAIAPASLVIGAFNAIYESFDKGDTVNELPSIGVTSFSQNAMAYGGLSGGVPNADVLWVGSGSVVQLRTAPDPAPLVATPTAFPGTTVTDIVLDPTEWGTAYVTDATDVYMTHDAGTTWTAITGNLTDSQLRSAVIDPGGIFGPARLFVGGRDGVFELALPTPGVIPGGPFVWGEIGTGLPNAPVWDMEYDVAADKLLVATLGRGAWTFQENGTCGFPKMLVVRNRMVSAAETFKACNEISGGPTLEVDAIVDFVAGVSIAFGSGTSLGGTVTVEIDAALISP